VDPTIEVLWSCARCRVWRAKLLAPARASGSDVLDWMQDTVAQVQRAHLARSPGCPARELTELLIPMEHTDYIGGPVKH
jgi:hypothetical protein